MGNQLRFLTTGTKARIRTISSAKITSSGDDVVIPQGVRTSRERRHRLTGKGKPAVTSTSMMKMMVIMFMGPRKMVSP